MLTQYVRTFVAATLAVACGAAGSPAAADDTALILGIFPRFSATDVHDAYAPMARYLSQALGREVKVETAKDQTAFWQAVTQGRYDIVHYNQMNYVDSHEKFGYDVIAMNEEFGKSTLASALVVRKDSGIDSVMDLKGKTVIFGGGPKAMVAYVGNYVLLKRAGLKKGDYKEEFSKSPANAIMAVYYKQAAAGGAGDVGFKMQAVDEKIETAELKFLAVGEPMPHLPWAARSTLGADSLKQIQTALLKLNNSPDGPSVLKSAQLTGLRSATDADYDMIRKIIKEAADE